MPDVVTDPEGARYRLVERDCPTCGPGRDDVLGRRGGPTHRSGHGVETTIVRCRRCGLLRPQPFPVPLDPGELYGDPEKYFEAHDAAAKVEGNRRIVRRLVTMTGLERPSLLDVGSGRGELLAAARAEGLDDVTGLELSPAMIRAAALQHGVTVLGETAEEHAERAGRTYDIVAMASVLEHVHDPDRTIESLAQLTKAGSVLYVELPSEPNLMTDVANLVNRLRRRDVVLNLSPTFAPYHVFGFDRRSLGALLAKHGFAVVESRVWAHPRIVATGGVADRVAAALATLVNRLANRVGRAANMEVWARRLADRDPR